MKTHSVFLRSLFAGTSLLVVSASLPAIAQEVDASAEDPAPESRAQMSLGQITVTAQRREESANEVPMAVQAFSGEQLDLLRVDDVDDLQTVVPGFSVSQSYQGVPTYTLRGIGFNTINVSATSTVGTYVDEVAYPFPFMNSGPMFDIDRIEVLKGPQGTLFGRNTTAGLINVVTSRPTDEFEASLAADVGNYDTFNLEGMINMPFNDRVQGRFAFRSETSGEGWQESNTRDETRGEVDRLGFRAALAIEVTENLDLDLSYNGWTNESDTIGGQGIALTPATDPTSPLAGSASLFLQPGLLNYIQTNQPTSASQADWAPRASRSATEFGVPGLEGPLREDSSFHAFKVAATLDLDNGMSLSSLTGYNELDRQALLDWSGSPYTILLQDIDAEITSFSQEFRLDGQFENASWVVGAYYARDEITDSNQTLLRDNANSNFVSTIATGLAYNPAGTLPLLNPAITPAEIAQTTALINFLNVDPETGLPYSPTDLLGSFQTYQDVGDFKNTSWSIFASADWELSPELTLTTGLRYTEDSQEYVGCSRDINGSMQPNVNVFNRFFFLGFYGQAAPAAPLQENGCVTYSETNNAFGPVISDLTEDNVSWRVAANYTPADMQDVLFFASISQGYKSAAVPVNAASKAEQNFPATQEGLLAYEAGIKAGLFEGRVQANVSAFFYDYTDKQVSSFFPDPIYTALSQLQNAPEAEAYGLDAEIYWQVSDELSAIAGMTLLNTEYTDFDTFDFAGRPMDASGDSFMYSPETSLSLTLVYDRPITDELGLSASLSGRWQSDSTAGDPDNPLYDIDSYGLLNGSIGVYSMENGWELSLWGKNLTDEYYWHQVSSNANVIMRFAGQPRTFGASFSYDF
ncbi:TonB-dependent receptor [Ponticaulis sp.]|uniref:TonB-dependent receptor n=1 Tax=Ponticaulis sp. TaxID=2020902 RepID=UPI000C4CF753|nr:TonB-dependent receptor [Ponticaulis sp.]MAF58698.1 TonB-dependent receptor [Ponticaulis sp.]MBN05334.1 TonB-dependent receptor [Ponticaulis sp.]